MYVAICNFRDGDRQVADEERQEDCENHLRNSPLVATRFRFPRIFDR